MVTFIVIIIIIIIIVIDIVVIIVIVFGVKASTMVLLMKSLDSLKLNK